MVSVVIYRDPAIFNCCQGVWQLVILADEVSDTDNYYNDGANCHYNNVIIHN